MGRGGGYSRVAGQEMAGAFFRSRADVFVVCLTRLLSGVVCIGCPR